jgi:hypothetical protein
MSHDVFCEQRTGCLCPWTIGPCHDCSCTCDLIEQVRAHERSLIIDNGREGMIA